MKGGAPEAETTARQIDALRQRIAHFLNFTIPEEPVSITGSEQVEETGYTRARISYTGDDGDRIPAFLLLPEAGEGIGAVLIHHQHHSQRHFGKSEPCGLVGDRLQAFGPVLAQQGIAVLAPDSICFEERRQSGSGTEPHERDTTEHYNELCYRLVRGDTLMRKVLSDSARGISVLRAHPRIAAERVGMMGHSYGGSTALFHAALDPRIRYVCSSGAACSYGYRIEHDMGIEMSQVIPGFASRYDLPDLVACIANRPLLLLSATQDNMSQDAAEIVTAAHEISAAAGITTQIEHRRYVGGHRLTQERFDDIVAWLLGKAL